MSDVIGSWTQMADEPPPSDERPGERSELWGEAWQRFTQNRMAMAGGIVLLLITLFAVGAPVLSRYVVHFGPYDQDLVMGPQPPLARSVPVAALGDHEARARIHWFGTDMLGRDLFVRVCYGARISLSIGILATLVSILIGVFYGAVSGYFGGALDAVMMRVVDVLFSLPYLLFVIMMMVFVGQHMWLLFLALGSVQWLTMSRVVRGQVMALKRRQFVEAARASGVREFTIIFRHLVPNTLGPIVVYATLTMPVVMLAEAFLSFLGLGIQPPDASWGTLAAQGAATMDLFPWMVVFPGLALAATLLSLNFLGDGLRDALDPTLEDRTP
jgi:oligopeptide transport system permease protein